MTITDFNYRGYTLAEVIDGLHAYYDGATDSGFKDPEMSKALEDYIEYLKSVGEDQKVLSRVVRDLCYSDEAIEQGGGNESAAGLIDWLSDHRSIREG